MNGLELQIKVRKIKECFENFQFEGYYHISMDDYDDITKLLAKSSIAYIEDNINNKIVSIIFDHIKATGDLLSDFGILTILTQHNIGIIELSPTNDLLEEILFEYSNIKFLTGSTILVNGKFKLEIPSSMKQLIDDMIKRLDRDSNYITYYAIKYSDFDFILTVKALNHIADRRLVMYKILERLD